MLLMCYFTFILHCERINSAYGLLGELLNGARLGFITTPYYQFVANNSFNSRKYLVTSAKVRQFEILETYRDYNLILYKD